MGGAETPLSNSDALHYIFYVVGGRATLVGWRIHCELHGCRHPSSHRFSLLRCCKGNQNLERTCA
jgi:hypothetical protein